MEIIEHSNLILYNILEGDKMKYVMIEVAFNNKEEVNLTEEKLLKEKLVASLQVLTSDSIWNYNGELESDKEYLVFMKTKESLINEVYKVIKEIHSYEVFEFAVFPLTSPSNDYLKWIEEETK